MENKTVLLYGSLLHDVGKVVYRGSTGTGAHSEQGATFIAEEVAPANGEFESECGKKVVEQIRFHHKKEMETASLPRDSLAYITYFADNVSAGMDRKNEGDEKLSPQFDKNIDLRKIFNILGGRHDDNAIGHQSYDSIRELLKRDLRGIGISWEEGNSLINLLEAVCAAVPSSTDRTQLVDVSLYDHAKTTAGIALCIYDYLAGNGTTDYRTALFGPKAVDYWAEPMFLLYSCDTSGIQDFIYTISGSRALKQLRARSLYLEMMLEHVVDELLDRLGLCRANLLYEGGGHAYLLLPNTDDAKRTIASFQTELKEWLLSNYGTQLFVAGAWVECSPNDLANKGEDEQRFPRLFRNLALKLSDAKANRYSASDIKMLNFGGRSEFDVGRECRECHSAKALAQNEDVCELCKSLEAISAQLVKKDVFAIIADKDMSSHEGEPALALPFGGYMAVYSKDEYLDVRPEVKRVYTKNSWDTGIGLSTHIWMGDYTAPVGKEGVSAYAASGIELEPGKGIKRLGVLRADVDNLGAAFVDGIPASKASISRTATLSRSLSYFFKHQINQVLEEGRYQLQVIYSGGDDLFIVGNWDDVIYAAIAINRAFQEYTGNGCLTISAGIGMFADKYPIARMAYETGALEDAAKLHVRKGSDGKEITKDAVALWSENSVFSWGELADTVEPLKREVAHIFDRNEKGKAFVYKMVDLLRNYDDVASAPRLAYLLARSFEDDKRESAEACRRLYELATDGAQRRCLVAALEWYVYSIRERG